MQIEIGMFSTQLDQGETYTPNITQMAYERVETIQLNETQDIMLSI